MFLTCKEFWYDSILRTYSKRKIAINIDDISSYFEYYDTQMKKTVIRVCLKTGRYHAIEGNFDIFHEAVLNYGVTTEGTDE